LDLTGQLKQRQLNTSQGDNPAHPALVVGNPDPMPAYGFPPVTLSSLPGAAQEATTIATLLDTEALIGAQATKSAVLQRMAQAPIIHLATHGLLNGAAIDTNARPGDQPTLEFRRLEGSLALAPEPSNDGFLTAEEIQNLRLTADLVVLSACDTGRGIVRGNGVMGLSSAFLQAGVPSVVVSLWQVPDEATAQLMERFYQALQDNPDKAAALRQAMIQSIGEFPHPRDWSAFLLIGEP
jgi:CHAT domain-containing protein